MGNKSYKLCCHETLIQQRHERPNTHFLTFGAVFVIMPSLAEWVVLETNKWRSETQNVQKITFNRVVSCLFLVEHRHPELLVQLEWWDGLLCFGALVLPAGVWIQLSESSEPQTKPGAGLHHSRVSPSEVKWAEFNSFNYTYHLLVSCLALHHFLFYGGACYLFF